MKTQDKNFVNIESIDLRKYYEECDDSEARKWLKLIQLNTPRKEFGRRCMKAGIQIDDLRIEIFICLNSELERYRDRPAKEIPKIARKIIIIQREKILKKYLKSTKNEIEYRDEATGYKRAYSPPKGTRRERRLELPPDEVIAKYAIEMPSLFPEKYSTWIELCRELQWRTCIALMNLLIPKTRRGTATRERLAQGRKMKTKRPAEHIDNAGPVELTGVQWMDVRKKIDTAVYTARRETFIPRLAEMLKSEEEEAKKRMVREYHIKKEIEYRDFFKGVQRREDENRETERVSIGKQHWWRKEFLKEPPRLKADRQLAEELGESTSTIRQSMKDRRKKRRKQTRKQ